MEACSRCGLSHALFGSVAESVLRRSSCPVFTVRNPKLPPGHCRVLSLFNLGANHANAQDND